MNEIGHDDEMFAICRGQVGHNGGMDALPIACVLPTIFDEQSAVAEGLQYLGGLPCRNIQLTSNDFRRPAVVPTSPDEKQSF
jgi:hypothetical protein